MVDCKNTYTNILYVTLYNDIHEASWCVSSRGCSRDHH